MTFCFLPLLRIYAMSCPTPDFMGELALQNFVSASDIILVHSLPCSLGSSHTSPLSKYQDCFNLRTCFFFLKCFPRLTSSHLSEASHLQIQCHFLKEMGNSSWSHPRHSLWISFFILNFTTLNIHLDVRFTCLLTILPGLRYKVHAWACFACFALFYVSNA